LKPPRKGGFLYIELGVSAMFSEIKNPYQKEPDVIKREFYDDYFDLYVWYYDHDKKLKGFQICYDKNNHERVFTWTKEDGYYHKGIDSQNYMSGNCDSPILVADRVAPIDVIIRRFEASSKGWESGLARYILFKLLEYKKMRNAKTAEKNKKV